MVRVGIVGAGFMGSMHAEVYRQFPNVKVAAIIDIRGEKAKSLAEKVGAIPYLDVEQVLNREDISILDICLPTPLHKEFVVRAAHAGKDIVCEKPIALTLEDAKEMIAACEKNKVRFMVAHVVRFWPEYVYLKESLDRERFGKLLSITCTRLSTTPTWGWQNWLMDGSRSGGALVDLHIHDADFLLYLTGKKPISVFSKGRSNPEQGIVHVFTMYKFPDDVIAFAEGGWDMPATYPFVMAYTAQFEKAVLEFNSRANPTLTVYYADGRIIRPQMERKSAGTTEGNISDLGGYFFELNHFIEYVIANKPFNVTTPQDALMSLELVLKEKESLETGKEVPVG